MQSSIHAIRRISRATLVALAGALLSAGGCPQGDGNSMDTDPNAAPTGGAVAPGPGEPGGFLYVLQPDAIAAQALADARFKWLVLEPSRTGNAAGEFTSDEITAIRNGAGCGQKTVLAYLSIGEAENYRDYWNAGWVNAAGEPIADVAPSWLGPSNPRWGGNYKVRYWDPDWQAVMLGTAAGPDKTPLDRIIDAGFDGVYLDIVDGYEFWSDPAEGYAELSRADARRRMIEFVIAIGEYARTTRGADDFLVFPQNAEGIVHDDAGGLDDLSTAYLSAIDGIGVEDLFYAGTSPQAQADVTRRVAALGEYRSRGKTVLVTDYVLRASYTAANSGARVEDLYRRSLDAGFIPYAAVADAALNGIVTFSGGDWSHDQPPACDEAAKGSPARLLSR
ncbi:MAG: endo alpha-1,4 polygalactosaminidase [Planctomycetes bacterium]|nr:endo alpha-1,4 polygalactosaminidase [Planctomycetota bacterium]